VFDLLLSADLMVPDPDGHTALLVKALGIHAHPNWRQALEGHAYIAHFPRVHKSLAVAPTRLETQHHVEIDAERLADPFFPPHLRSLTDFQGEFRPMKTHSVVVATDHIEELIDRLMSRRLPFRIAPIDTGLPFKRVWLGMTPENPRYSPDVDGGLCLEFIPIRPLQLPPDTFADPAPEPRDPAPGEMIRIVGRGYLVRDLDATLGLLATNLGWEPLDGPEEFADEGIRRARMGFTLRNSSTLDLIEPTHGDCETGMYLNTWGPGPYYARIAVNGLDAKAADLESRGTRFSWLPDSAAAGGRRIQVAADDLDGTLIEFVEYAR
jgi:hypothetical protein